MRHIQAHVARRQAEFSQHSFFGALDGQALQIEPCATALAFWVLSFQDVLELNASRVRDPALRSIAEQHRVEDTHHEQWYLDDLVVLGIGAPDVRSLFGAAPSGVRAASYAIASEVFRAEADEDRIVLLLALEGASHVFFERISTYLACVDPRYDRLKYFARSHLAVEKDHDLFSGSEPYVAGLELDGEQRERCMMLVDRVYAAFRTMFDVLVEVGSRSDRASPPARQPASG